jgi:heme/copper-type cytochrome/quinol oxidase subunit 3
MSTSLEQIHEEPEHGLAPYVQVARARAGVLLLILSDALSIIAILAGGGYLNALNTENQFRIAGDNAPTFLPGLLVAIVLLLSGLVYYWWERSARKRGVGAQLIVVVLAWVLMIGALVGQIWIGRTLGYNSPFQAYESVILLLTWYSAVHLLLAVIIGLLLLGRVLRGRIVEHDYIAEVTGYWWYYTVIASLLIWLFVLLFK